MPLAAPSSKQPLSVCVCWLLSPPDPATKKLFYTLAIKLLADRTDEWYRCFFYNLRMEMEGYFNAQLIMNLAEVSTIEVEGYDYEANEE